MTVHDPDYPDVDPATGDEAETHQPRHYVLEVHNSVLGQTATPPER